MLNMLTLLLVILQVYCISCFKLPQSTSSSVNLTRKFNSFSSHLNLKLNMMFSNHKPDRTDSNLRIVEINPQHDMNKQILRVSSTLLSITSLFLLSSQKAMAIDIEEVNNKLAGYDLPPILFVPSGFSPLVSEFGRGNVKEKMDNPILVQFVYPNSWIVQKTSVNNNGEAGTISANDYIKGDSAFLFTRKLDTKQDSAGNLQIGNKAAAVAVSKNQISNFLLKCELILPSMIVVKALLDAIAKAISQKGDLVDNMKILAITPGVSGVNGQNYVIVEFSYQLNTEAGFLIDRRAIASVASVGDSLQGLISATTSKRFKTVDGMENKLRNIANSFRVYKLQSGIFAGAA